MNLQIDGDDIVLSYEAAILLMTELAEALGYTLLPPKKPPQEFYQ